MKNAVQLITYVDRLSGGGIGDLANLLRTELSGLFAGVHLLPFFHPIDGADAGFDPIDHTVVDPRLGTWDDVKALSKVADVMADVIVNHVSSRSPEFLDFLAHGRRSRHAGLFLTYDGVFPDRAGEAELARIYRPRRSLPFTVRTLETGEERILWTTFTEDQIDIDVRSPEGEAYLQRILETLARAGVTMVRLDAAGHAVKVAGTPCYMIPETYEFIGGLSQRARALGIEVLVEMHGYYEDQIAIARRVDRVYDFALPPLLLYALFRADAGPLRTWLARSPRNAITVLDTHDGIGVADVGADPAAPASRPGLLAAGDIAALVEEIHRRSGGESRQASGAAASNLDFSQVNCTYYDALGRDDRAYLIARAIQFFAPGVPQVYYVGLLAGRNDMALLARTRGGRDINRRYYTPATVREALAQPVVGRLCDLIRFRNTHPAFAGELVVGETPPHAIRLEWRDGPHAATLDVDLAARTAAITGTGLTGAFDVTGPDVCREATS